MNSSGQYNINAQNSLAGQYAGKAIGSLMPSKLGSYINQLEAMLKGCYDQGTRLENLADRILGSTPQEVANSQAAPMPSSVAGQFESLCESLATASRRIESAIQRLETL